MLGLVQNMSHYVCPNCQHKAHIFGHDGAREVGKQMDIELLGTAVVTESVNPHSQLMIKSSATSHQLGELGGGRGRGLTLDSHFAATLPFPFPSSLLHTP